MQDRHAWLRSIAGNLTVPAEDLPLEIDYGKGLTPVQLEALQTQGEPFAMLWGRRTGKTHTLPRMLLRAAAQPDTWSVYLTKTRKNAKLLLWRWLKRAARELLIPHHTNETDLVLEVAGGGSILLGGADDMGAIERWRQFGWKLAILDEMGVYPNPLLVSLIDDVLQPATADCGGQLVYSGTPGYVLDGRWYQLSGPSSRIRVLRADARSNIAVPGLWDRILRIKEENGWDDDHPTWIREYLGRWVEDQGALVYPYSPERNGARALPRVGRTGANLLPSGWRFGIGIDIGYVHASAFVVMAIHPEVPEEYIVHSEKRTEQIARQVAERIRTLRIEIAERFNLRPDALKTCPVVMDTGGIGKPYAEECRRVHAIPVEAAEKRDKESAVRMMRGDLLSGRLKILDGPECDPIRAEFATLGWDDEKRLPNKDHDAARGGAGDHAADAALYIKRKMRHARHVDPPAPIGSDARQEQLMEEHAARLAKRYTPRKGRYSWDR